MANPYQVLRIQPDSDPDQIEDAYHRMRKLVSYGGAGAGVTEQAVNTAYALLTDPYRRALVDAALRKRRRSRATVAPVSVVATLPTQRKPDDAPKERLFSRLLRMVPFL